jgi:hypothetical protein
MVDLVSKFNSLSSLPSTYDREREVNIFTTVSTYQDDSEVRLGYSFLDIMQVFVFLICWKCVLKVNIFTTVSTYQDDSEVRLGYSFLDIMQVFVFLICWKYVLP